MVVLETPGRIRVRERPERGSPGAAEALVRVLRGRAPSGAAEASAWITSRADPDGFVAAIVDRVRPSSGVVKALVARSEEAIDGRPAAAHDGR